MSVDEKGGERSSSDPTEKVIDFPFWLDTTVDLRKWLRFQWGDLEPPRAAALRGLNIVATPPQESSPFAPIYS